MEDINRQPLDVVAYKFFRENMFGITDHAFINGFLEEHGDEDFSEVPAGTIITSEKVNLTFEGRKRVGGIYLFKSIEDGSLWFGWSLCEPRDNFNSFKAIEIAKNRAVPYTFENVKQMKRQLGKYFEEAVKALRGFENKLFTE